MHVIMRLQTRRVHAIETSVESHGVVCDGIRWMSNNQRAADVVCDIVPATEWYFFRPSFGCLCTIFLV